MAGDRISITYDANVDDLRRKLDELIGLNDKLAQHAFAAAKAIGAISDAQKGMSGKFKIVNQEITKIDYSTKISNDTINKFGQTAKNAAGGLTKMDNSINTTNTSIKHFDNSVKVTANTVNNFDNSIRNSFNTVNRMGSQLDSVKNSVSGFEGVLSRVASRMAAYFAIDSIISFGKSLITLERDFEMIQNRMNFVFDTAGRGEAGFNRLRNLSMRLGLDVKETANAFSAFGIAAKMSGFSAEESEKIFTKVAVSLRGAGANSLQSSRAFYALQQMLSKGVVSAEELRRQLGESLPGASDLMAEAYRRLHPEANVTTASFNKLLEIGKILSAEILPEFSKVLEETFSPAVEAKMSSLDAAINRLSNGFDALKLSILNAKAVSGGINLLGGYLDNLGVVIRSNMPWYNKLAEIFLTFLPNLPFTGFLGLDRSIANTAAELKKVEVEVQKMDDFAERLRQKNIQRIANRFLEKNNGDFTKAIIAQNNLLREESNKSVKNLSEDQKRIREARIENARLVVAELNRLRTLSQKSTGVDPAEAEKEAKEKAKKAAEEALAAEQFRLTQLTKGTEEYNKQLISIIDAQITLKKISFADTPEQLKLALAELNKLKKETEALTKMESFKAAFELSVIEREPIEEQLKKYKQFIDSKTEYELAKNNYSENEKKALIKKSEKEIEKFRLDSLNKRLELEIKQVEKQISDISRIEGKAVSTTVGIGVDASGVDKIDAVTGNRVVGVEAKVDADELKGLDDLLKGGKQLEIQISPEIDQSGLSGVNELLKDKDAKIDVSIGREGESQAKDLLKRLEDLKKQVIKNDIAIKDLSATTAEETASNAIEQETRAQALIGERRKSELQNEIIRQKVLVLSTQEGTEERLKAEQDLLTREAELRKLDALESKDSAEKKALNIKLIDEQLKEDLGRLNKEFLEKTSEENRKAAELDQKIRDAIERSEADSYGRRILKIKQFYRKLIVEARVAGRDTSVIENAMTKEISKEQVKQVNEFINTAGDLYNRFTQVQEMEYDNQKVALKNKLEQGLISEEQYNAEVTRLEKKRFDQNKEAQKVNVLINSASAIIRAFTDLGPVAGAIAAFAIGAMAIKQTSVIDSSQFPEGFKEGVIDLKGPGTETSDSIPARLSRGESVMTAQETRDYKPVLQAIRDNNFEEFVSKRYIDAMNGNRSSVSDSFAKNISSSIELNNIEVIDAIRKNKSVRISNWDDFDRVLRKPRTAHKIVKRRAW